MCVSILSPPPDTSTARPRALTNNLSTTYYEHNHLNSVFCLKNPKNPSACMYMCVSLSYHLPTLSYHIDTSTARPKAPTAMVTHGAACNRRNPTASRDPQTCTRTEPTSTARPCCAAWSRTSEGACAHATCSSMTTRTTPRCNIRLSARRSGAV